LGSNTQITGTFVITDFSSKVQKRYNIFLNLLFESCIDTCDKFVTSVVDPRAEPKKNIVEKNIKNNCNKEEVKK
jgi:hypothetical protein